VVEGCLLLLRRKRNGERSCDDVTENIAPIVYLSVDLEPCPPVIGLLVYGLTKNGYRVLHFTYM
jgi:hypothetical protein